MATTLAPLCPICLQRVLHWSATVCPGCRETATIAPCDSCRKSRAGAFVAPSGFKELEGAQSPFLCRDCMEEALEARAEARLTETVWGVAIVLFSVFWWKWMPAWGTAAAFVLTLVALGRWFLAVRKRNAPGKSRDATTKFFAARIVKAMKSREKALK
jgi:hypothetical protein